MRQTISSSLLIATIFIGLSQPIVADTNYWVLTDASPLRQDWSDINLITVNDNWSGVPSIMGYRGDDPLIILGDNDPQTILTDYSGIPDVNANQSVPNVFATAGVTEFQITDPTVALAGSGASDFPNLDIRLNTLACPAGAASVNVSYNVRDIESSSDNSVQQVALQYRVGPTGNYTNIPAGYIADATTGPSVATLVTPISANLPPDAQGQSQVHVRILTSNASGNDEWIGIDDLNVTCQPLPTAAPVSLGGRVTTPDGRGISNAVVTLFSGDLSQPRRALTNPFGYYVFPDLTAGETYVVNVSSKSFVFERPTRVVNLVDETNDLDFVAERSIWSLR